MYVGRKLSDEPKCPEGVVISTVVNRPIRQASHQPPRHMNHEDTANKRTNPLRQCVVHHRTTNMRWVQARCARRARRLSTDSPTHFSEPPSSARSTTQVGNRCAEDGSDRMKLVNLPSLLFTCNARTKTALTHINGRLTVELEGAGGVVVRPHIVQVSVTINFKGSLHTVVHSYCLGDGWYTNIPFAGLHARGKSS